VPRRGAAAALGTVAGVALLLSFRTPDGPTVSAADPRLALGAATPAPTQAVSGDGSTRARTPTSTSTPAPTQTATTGAQQVVDGRVVNTRYGPVQVEVTLKGSTITDVQALELPSDRRTSAEISQTVAPWLHDEALQAQSANIDIISGATYTSTAYAESLQSALDSAG
jgi:uncharacterized protein with FMN-binding domain